MAKGPAHPGQLHGVGHELQSDQQSPPPDVPDRRVPRAPRSCARASISALVSTCAGCRGPVPAAYSSVSEWLGKGVILVATYTELSTRRGVFGVRRHGDAGPWVVCLHGFPDDASTFDGLAGALAAAGHRVAAVNLRGYAPSPLAGSLALDDLVDDLAAVVDELSPEAPVALVGHDYGAQLAYPAMARAPHRFSAAVLLAGAHPAVVARNARRSARQLWMSRYIVFFQLGAVADRRVARHDFAYVEALWRRWAPGFTLPAEHLAHVRATLAASMPGPVAMYRAGGFDVAEDEIGVPTLFVGGEDDGCALPFLADGQEVLFTAGYRAEIWAGTGHFPHLEHPGRTAGTVIDWLDGRER